ncbi:MAG: LysR family transcriptional regulator [Thiotrichales bacterium]|nr:MAG: LysR family transcriptional regulator [Thiotrichales bacterium]
MKLPSIRQLQYFLAVIEERHFGRAAKTCFVTQSTLSVGIQELENILGVKLLERNKRNVMPTSLGLALADIAHQVIATTTDLVEQAQGENGPLVGKFRLGVIPTIGPFLLPRVLPNIRQHYPKLKLQLIEDQTARLIERLNSGQIDCAILALPYDISAFESEVFWQEIFYVAFPPNHPLSKGAPILSSELPMNEVMLLEEGHCMRDHSLKAFHTDNKQHKDTVQGTSLYTMMEMVAGGEGITFIPEMAIESALIERSNICLRALAEQGPHREIALVWRPTFLRKNNLQLLIKVMKETLSQQA